jgi:hypothetical protein
VCVLAERLALRAQAVDQLAAHGAAEEPAGDEPERRSRKTDAGGAGHAELALEARAPRRGGAVPAGHRDGAGDEPEQRRLPRRERDRDARRRSAAPGRRDAGKEERSILPPRATTRTSAPRPIDAKNASMR